MSIEALVPAGGTHAIQGVAFVITWSVELTDSELVKIERLHDVFKKALPISQRVEMMSLTVQDVRPGFGVHKNSRKNQPQTTQQSKSLGAIHFVRPGPLGIPRPARAVQANKGNLVLLINDYKGWDEATAFLGEVLNVLLPIVVNGRPVSGAMLQYTDSFTWKDEPALLQWPEVFKADTGYVSKSAFQHSGLWHSHHGYMQDLVEPVPHQLIENVNVDVVQQAAYRVINIFTSHNGSLRSGAWTVEAAIASVNPLFSSFHDRNKRILRGLLADQVLQKIGLMEDQK